MSRNSNRARLTVQRLEDRATPVVFANPTTALRAGTLDYTGVVRIDGPGGMGSGTLLPTGRHVLTAAHVVTGDTDTVIDGAVKVTFQMAGRSNVPLDVPVSSITVHSGWAADWDTPDVAVLTLPEVAPVWATRHQLYRATNEVGQTGQVVGYGQTGGGENGAEPGTSGTKRAGRNYIEFDDEGPNTLAIDLTDNDDLSLEATIAPGDSGGPLLIGDRIAGIASYCRSGGWDSLFDIDLTPDSDFNDLGVYVRASALAGWIDAQTGPRLNVTLNMANYGFGNDGVADDWGVFRDGEWVNVWRGNDLVWSARRSEIGNELTIFGSRDDENFDVASDTGLTVRVNSGGGWVNELTTLTHSTGPQAIRNDVEVYDDRVEYRWGAPPSAAPFRRVFHAGMSSVTVLTGNGTDYVYVDSPNSPSLTIDTLTGGGLVNFRRLSNRGATAFVGAGTDEVLVGVADGSSVLGGVTVHASGGGAKVQVGGLDRVAWVDVSGSVASVSIDDGLDGSIGNTYDVRADRVYRNGVSEVWFDTVGELVLKTGTQRDTIAVTSVPGKTTIDAGGGKDAVTVGSATGSLSIFGDVTVNAGTGGGDLVLNDRGRNYRGEGMYTVSNSQVSSWSQANTVLGTLMSGRSDVRHAGFDTLRLNAGGEGDLIRLSTTATGPAVKVYAGGGNDIVVGGAGHDDLYGEDGLDVLIGGAGFNGLYGGANDDILVGGRTTLDGNDAQLKEVRRIWTTPGKTAAERKELLAPVLSNANMLGGMSYGEPGAGDNLLWGINLFQLSLDFDRLPPQ